MTRLPEPTRIGANTFGCKINGEVFAVSGDPESNWNKNGVTFFPSGTMYIKAQLGDNNTTSYVILRVAFSQDTTYILSYDNVGEYTEYTTDSARRGTVTFKYDGSIIYGTFSFDAINSAGHFIHVTEGRFDIKRTK